jgi:hypothetical protein
MAENTQTLLRQLAEMLDKENRAELPPEREDLVKEWSGRVIHVLRPLQLPGGVKDGGGIFRRGATVTISEQQVRSSIDRKGNSLFDGLLESGAVGEGAWPEDLDLWVDDDDPMRTALHREAVANLKATNPNATGEMWAALHARYGTKKQRAEYAKDQAERDEMRRRAYGAHE